jgi:Dockerin type I domain
MMQWMRRLARRAAEAWAARRSRRPRRAGRVGVRLGFEGLEQREVVSALGGVPFASITADITAPGRSTVVVFRVEPGTFVSDRSMPAVLGLDATPALGSSVDPKVVKIVGLNGALTRGIPTVGGPLFAHIAVPVTTPSEYAVRVIGREGSTGPFELDAFLPGDVNNDGVVDRTDLGLIRKAYGSREGGPRYNPAADFNNAGAVGLIDLALARRNLGVRSSVIALSTANLRPS